MNPIINLWESVGLGLIIEYPSGVLYSNQSGGTVCMHPQVEGVFVPIRNDMDEAGTFLSPECELLNYFKGHKYSGTGATEGLDSADADFIDLLLDNNHLGNVVVVNRQRLIESCESWVHVLIQGNENNRHELALFQHFSPYPRAGILTWVNSD